MINIQQKAKAELYLWITALSSYLIDLLFSFLIFAPIAFGCVYECGIGSLLIWPARIGLSRLTAFG